MKPIDKINGIVGIDHPNNVQLVLSTYDLGLRARRPNGITYADHFTVGQLEPDVLRCSTIAAGRNPVPKVCGRNRFEVVTGFVSPIDIRGKSLMKKRPSPRNFFVVRSRKTWPYKKDFTLDTASPTPGSKYPWKEISLKRLIPGRK